jgi:hypothetical protein
MDRHDAVLWERSENNRETPKRIERDIGAWEKTEREKINVICMSVYWRERRKIQFSNKDSLIRFWQTHKKWYINCFLSCAIVHMLEKPLLNRSIKRDCYKQS